jgi:hypothetical protein
MRWHSKQPTLQLTLGHRTQVREVLWFNSSARLALTRSRCIARPAALYPVQDVQLLTHCCFLDTQL